MPITLKQYWAALNESLKEFDKTNTIKSLDVKDEKSYQLQRTFLDTLFKLGMEVESISLTLFKTSSGLKLAALPTETFGKSEVITSLGGPKSIAFARQVYLPSLQRFNEVTYADQNESFRLLSDLGKQKENTVILMKRLIDVIRESDKSAESVALDVQKSSQRIVM